MLSETELSELRERIERIRQHKHFSVFVATLEVDREEWAALDGTEGEDYVGEARSRVEVYDAAILLLTGKPYRRQPMLRLVTGDDDESA
jgi:hypothetical protein